MSLRAFESLTTVDLLAGLAATVAVATFFYNRHRAPLNLKNGLPLPPGPPARWFWQNALPTVKWDQFPVSAIRLVLTRILCSIARTLADWIAEYGPVMTLRQGSRIIIIVGRVDVCFPFYFACCVR